MNSGGQPPLPLCVDLDGTLIRSDMIFECLVRALRSRPWVLLLLPLWLLRGKAFLKAKLAALAEPDVAALPYDEAVLSLVREARGAGRPVGLVTGTHRLQAERISEHLGLFDFVLSTDDETNLTGSRKAAALSERYGHGGFEYAGNEHVDLPIWSVAASAVTVGASRSLRARAEALDTPVRHIDRSSATLKTWARALRLHQWAKNLLLFLPLITSHRIFDIDALVPTTIGFVCMGLCASGTYLLNDLFDLDADRVHKRKRNRPLASGALSIRSGLVGSVVLVGVALLLGWLLLPLAFFGALTAYLVFTLLYSFRLKRFASLDVIMLAGLFTLRIIAGAAAAEVVLSFWLLAFSMFIFLSLAVVKRVSELVQLREKELEEGRPVEAKGREYATSDLTILQALGACSGYLSVLVLALYINSDDVAVLYGTPELLWLVAPILLLWVTRIWIVTARGYMDEDPIFFAIKDPETWAVAGLTGVAIMGAKFLEVAL